MIKIIPCILLLLSVSVFSLAQKIENMSSFRDVGAERYFRFSYDNDFFTATDKNYTQGYNFEFVSPFFKKNPINYIFYKPKNSQQKYGLSLEHIGFTPADYSTTEIQLGDRPFASAIMLKSFVIATNADNKTRVASAFNLGVIGPSAFGEAMQVEIHKATGNVIPQGWPNQIQNHVVLNYEVGIEKQLLRYKNYFSVQTNSQLRLGTLFTDASVGFNTSFGLINNAFDTKAKSKLNLYIYAQPMLIVIGHDATLQGSILSKKKSVYTIPSEKIERIRTQLNYGIVMQVGGMYFEYSQAFQSREFDGAEYYRWGGLKAGFVF